MTRLILSSLLAASLIAPSFSFADAGSDLIPIQSVQIHADATREPEKVVVAHITQANERDLVRQLAAHEDVVFLTARSNDPVNSEIDGRQNVIFSSDQAAEMPYFRGPGGAAELEKFQLISRHAHTRGVPVGLLVALIPASGYGAYYWYLSSQFMLSAGAFAWQYLVASAITMGSRHWLNFSNQVGLMTSDSAVLLGAAFGKRWSQKAVERWHRLGKVLSAYGLNLTTSLFLNTLIGVHKHDISFNAFVFLFALFSSSEVVDYHSESILKEEERVRSAMIARLALYSGIEIAALSGSQSAEIVAGTSVAAAILSFIFKDESDSIYSAAKGGIRNLWSKAKSAFKRGKESTCAEDLMGRD